MANILPLRSQLPVMMQASHLIRGWMCWSPPLTFYGHTVPPVFQNPISLLKNCTNVLFLTFWHSRACFFAGHHHACAWSHSLHKAAFSKAEKAPALAALLNPLTFLLSSQDAFSGGLRAEPSAALCNIPRINVLRCCGWKTAGCGWFLTTDLPVSTTTAPR